MSAIDELEAFDQAFVYEYIKDFNGTRAAERAGHQGNDNVLAVTASRLLRNVKIKAAIKEQLNSRAMEADEVLSRLSDTARFDPSEFFIKKRSKHYINLDAIKEAGLGHLIKELSYDRKGNLVVKFDDRQVALINIGKQHGLFSDHHIVDVRLEKEVDTLLDILEQELTPDDYQRILARLGGSTKSQSETGSETE